MKIRQGFVSNSSTTSFCIMGTSVTTDDEGYDEVESYSCPLYDKKDFTSFVRPYSRRVYVGIPVSAMGEQETREELRQRAKEGLKEVGIDVNPTFITSGWREG